MFNHARIVESFLKLAGEMTYEEALEALYLKGNPSVDEIRRAYNMIVRDGGLEEMAELGMKGSPSFQGEVIRYKQVQEALKVLLRGNKQNPIPTGGKTPTRTPRQPIDRDERPWYTRTMDDEDNELYGKPNKPAKPKKEVMEVPTIYIQWHFDGTSVWDSATQTKETYPRNGLETVGIEINSGPALWRKIKENKPVNITTYPHRGQSGIKLVEKLIQNAKSEKLKEKLELLLEFFKKKKNK